MEVLQLVVYGIVTGSIVALGAIGVSLVFSILRFAHFAHGDVMTVGAYGALVGVTLIGVTPMVAIPVAILFAVVAVLGAEFCLYRPLRSSHPVILLISSFGYALILRSAIQLVAGPAPQVFKSGIQIPYRFGEIVIRPDHFWIVGGTILIIVALHLFLSRSKFGKAMRAMSDNMDLARISGIPAYRMILITWVIAAALAAVAGVFLGMDTRLHPVMGWRLLLPVFAAAILGGIGRPYGAIAGGFIIGISMELSTMVIDPGYKHAVAFALLVLMLIIRPTGLFRGTSL